jgi:peptide/nickel transport system ATP-binding protein
MNPTPPPNTTGRPLLDVRDLSVHYPAGTGAPFKAVDALSFSIAPGETLALVGESGCGKSATALSIMRLVQKPGIIAAGNILFDGRNLLEFSELEMQQLRGGTVSMVFQEPMTSLNPVLTVGFQITEGIMRHKEIGTTEACREAVRLLEQVGIPAAQERYHAYPHQLSGGMKQRVMIAMALSCRPRLLIADEPTTALDVTIQAEILELIDRLKADLEMSLLLITHNLGIVAERADRTVVMYAGRAVETAPTEQLLASPLHPYTRGLLASLPQNSPPRTELPTIPAGEIRSLSANPGCLFSTRCPFSSAECDQAAPTLIEADRDHKVACWKVPHHE